MIEALIMAAAALVIPVSLIAFVVADGIHHTEFWKRYDEEQRRIAELKAAMEKITSAILGMSEVFQGVITAFNEMATSVINFFAELNIEPKTAPAVEKPHVDCDCPGCSSTRKMLDV